MNRITSSIKLFVLVSSFSVGGLYAFAQNAPSTSSPPTTPTPGSTPGSSTALNRLNNAVAMNFMHHMNLTEINEASVALFTSNNQAVRTYAQTMITEHQQNEQNLIQLANQKNVPIYAYQPSTVNIATDAELQSLPNNEFDSAYLQVQLNEHRKALQDLNLLRSQVTDSDIQNLINQTIPAIQKHVDLANSSISSAATPTPTSTPTAISTPSPTPTDSPSPDPTDSPTPTSSPSPSASPTSTSSPTL
jgi:predicted outer membrane protein